MKVTITTDQVSLIRDWCVNRGGIAVWPSHDLSNLTETFTPWITEGVPANQRNDVPHWRHAKGDCTCVQLDDINVTVDKEVARFHVALRVGSQGLKVKLTDASSRKLEARLKEAGEGSRYEFDYENQEAVIFKRTGGLVPLKDYPL